MQCPTCRGIGNIGERHDPCLRCGATGVLTGEALRWALLGARCRDAMAARSLHCWSIWRLAGNDPSDGRGQTLAAVAVCQMTAGLRNPDRLAEVLVFEAGGRGVAT